jgi:LacI family transcriptional regulator
MAAEHLLDRGFQCFAYCGFEDMFGARSRGESFRKRIAEAGFETYSYEQPRAKVRRSWESEKSLMADWLKKLPKPVGLMTCTDDRSQDVIEACKIDGLHVPEQVAIIGVDNDEMVCELSTPPLSSITLNTEKAGYEAAELLDKMMAGKKAANEDIIVQPTRIVTRQSTDILAIDDSDVAEAVRFIRQHSREIIQVGDVVDAVALSRRALQQRFKSILGCSVYDEIRRCRIEQIATMLVETHLSIAQVASAFGYPGIEKLSRYFQREKGMTPVAYRKRYGH